MRKHAYDLSIQVIATTLAVMLALGTLIPGLQPLLAQQAFATSKEAQMRIAGYINYTSGSWHTHMYSTDDGEGEVYAYCVDPEKDTPEEKTYKKRALVTPSGRDAEMRADMWFVYDGPGFDKSMWPSTNWDGEPMSKSDYYLVSHILLADTFNSNGKYAMFGASAHFKKWLAKYITGFDLETGELINSKALGRVFMDRIGEVPSDFEAYLIAGGDAQNLACSSYYEPHGTVKMNKKSANAKITKGNKCYSMKGISYGVYTNRSCDSAHDTGMRIELDASGYGELSDVPMGTYYVRELESSVEGTGYAYDPSVYTLKVEAGKESWVHDTVSAAGDADENDVTDEPQSEDVNILIQKRDALTGSATASGYGSLENAQFKIRYFANLEGSTTGKPTRTWQFRTDANGQVNLRDSLGTCLVTGDALYYDDTGTCVLPLGTYEITETLAPASYELPVNDASVSFVVRANGTGVHEVSSGGVLSDSGIIFDDNPTRHDFVFTKRDLDTQRPMNGIPFLVSRIDTSNGNVIERHVIVTDANGMFDSSATHADHGYHTNENDRAVSQRQDGSYVVNEALLNADYGVWFGITSRGTWVDSKNDSGAFPDNPMERFVFEELPVAANEGKALVKFDAYAHAAHSTSIDLGTIGNPTPTIATVARDAADGDKLVSRDLGACIADTVNYAGLVAGNEYTLVGLLRNAETGEALLDEGGNQAQATTSFTASACSGTIDLAFPFDATAVADGTRVVVCETLYEGNRKLCEHDELDDGSQTVTIVQPAITTHACDDADEDSKLVGDIDATIRDRVTYAGLVKGAEYTLEGRVIDKATGQTFSVNGIEVTAQTSFTAQDTAGHTDVIFTFDASELEQGHEFVAFERLLHDGVEICTHEDIDDAGQTVSVFPPSIQTRALDPDDGDNVISADAESTFVDTVTFAGLKPGHAYTLKGTLVDKETGHPLLDSFERPITAAHVFTPVEPNGSTEVTFHFDAASVDRSKTGVVFEELHRDGRHLASHINLEDAPQVIVIEPPSIQTFASVDGISKAVMRDKSVTIVDRVMYRNLKKGKTYTLEGLLMDKSGACAVLDDAGNPLTSSQQFTAESTSGSIELPFTFDATRYEEGSELVVYERLVHEGVTLAVHEDLDDIAQTVTVSKPEISTSAKTRNDTKELIRDIDSTIIDAVSYKNLLPGQEYVIDGTLMDKASGQPLLDENGMCITGQTRFTPESANGETSVAITFDASDLEPDTTLVVFETLSHDASEIASHEDIEDEAQAVVVRPATITTKASDPIDGDQVVTASEETRVLDTVMCEGLKPGADYELRGSIVDKETQEPLLDAQGNPLRASKAFTASEQSAQVEMDFAPDMTGMRDERAYVIFQELYREGKLLAAHANIDNTAQTILVAPPHIATHAADASDGDKELDHDKVVTITDSVEYWELSVGKSYRVEGRLMVNDGTLEGTPALDARGVPITAQASFTPDATHGSVDVSFEVDTSIIKDGTYLVAFETLTHEGTVLATHEDIQDEEQTIRVVSPTLRAFTKAALSTFTPTSTPASATPFVAGKAVDTGDTPIMALCAACAVISLLALGCIAWSRYRGKTRIPDKKGANR